MKNKISFHVVCSGDSQVGIQPFDGSITIGLDKNCQDLLERNPDMMDDLREGVREFLKELFDTSTVYVHSEFAALMKRERELEKTMQEPQ